MIEDFKIDILENITTVASENNNAKEFIISCNEKDSIIIMLILINIKTTAQPNNQNIEINLAVNLGGLLS